MVGVVADKLIHRDSSQEEVSADEMEREISKADILVVEMPHDTLTRRLVAHNLASMSVSRSTSLPALDSENDFSVAVQVL